MPQPKDRDWLNGYKNKTRIHSVYKKPTSDLKGHERMGNIFHANEKQKSSNEYQSSYQTNQTLKITRDKEGHYIMIKGSIQDKDITIVNIYIPNIGAPQYIRQTLIDIKGEIDSNTIIVGGFNSPLTPMHRSLRQKINKETQVLNGTFDEMDLIDIFRPSHPNAEEYTFS